MPVLHFIDPLLSQRGLWQLAVSVKRGSADRDLQILDFIRPHFSNYFALFSREVLFPMNTYTAAELADDCRLLSRREAEVASLLCRRLRPDEIATVLLISPRTVERHIENIYSKLNVRNRKELLKLLLKGPPGDGQHLN